MPFPIDDRIQAFAIVFNMTPDAVIREACKFFLSHKVGTPITTKPLWPTINVIVTLSMSLS